MFCSTNSPNLSDPSIFNATHALNALNDRESCTPYSEKFNGPEARPLSKFLI